MGVSSVLMVQGCAEDLGNTSPPVGSRDGAPVGGLRDEVPQNLKLFCILLNFKRPGTEFSICGVNRVKSALVLRLTVERSCLAAIAVNYQPRYMIVNNTSPVAIA